MYTCCVKHLLCHVKGKGKENESEGKDGENDAKPAEGKGEAGGKEEQPARATQPPRDDGKSE